VANVFDKDIWKNARGFQLDLGNVLNVQPLDTPCREINGNSWLSYSAMAPLVALWGLGLAPWTILKVR
jgi:hypothetical protein